MPMSIARQVREWPASNLVIATSGEFGVIHLFSSMIPEVLIPSVGGPCDVAPSPMDVDTTENGRPRLAQELLDLILDHLHHHPESLKRSALASKSLLPTCQRHLFSTFQITKSTVNKLAELFRSSSLTNGRDAGLRARVTDLLNTYTTNLILTSYPEIMSGAAMKKAHLPEFKNAQKITFRGNELKTVVKIPSFLEQTWMSSPSKLRSIEFNFRGICERAILGSLYLLPAAVEDVSFTGNKRIYTHLSAASIREDIDDQPLPLRPGVRRFNGTLKLRLAPDASYEKLLLLMLELDDLFKFSLKRINYRLTCRSDIRHVASLVEECKNTLQFLDIPVSSPRAYRV